VLLRLYRTRKRREKTGGGGRAWGNGSQGIAPAYVSREQVKWPTPRSFTVFSGKPGTLTGNYGSKSTWLERRRGIEFLFFNNTFKRKKKKKSGNLNKEPSWSLEG